MGDVRRHQGREKQELTQGWAHTENSALTLIFDINLLDSITICNDIHVGVHGIGACVGLGGFIDMLASYVKTCVCAGKIEFLWTPKMSVHHFGFEMPPQYNVGQWNSICATHSINKNIQNRQHCLFSQTLSLLPWIINRTYCQEYSLNLVSIEEIVFIPNLAI